MVECWLSPQMLYRRARWMDVPRIRITRGVNGDGWWWVGRHLDRTSVLGPVAGMSVAEAVEAWVKSSRNWETARRGM